jgi:hypothetical protein
VSTFFTVLSIAAPLSWIIAATFVIRDQSRIEKRLAALEKSEK